MRAAAAVEKLKKVLSANAAAPISVESIMEDKDVSGFLKRDELEGLMKPLLERCTKPLEQALADAKLKQEDIDFVELVGGTSRVPALKQAVTDFFGGKTLNFTLNADEAIARGCAFSCAILSPVFRVRDFSVQDVVNYPIEFTWEKSPDIPDEDTSLTVFNRGNAMPSTKILTFYRKQPFDLEAKYAKPDMLPGKMNPWIGRFSVKGVKADSKDDFMICKLKARLNLHGVLNVEQGYYVEEQEVEEPVPEKEGEKNADVSNDFAVGSASVSNRKELEGEDAEASKLSNGRADAERAAKRAKTEPSLTSKQAMETDDKAANGEAKPPAQKTRKVKKQVRKGDLPISSGTASLTDEIKNQYAEQEGQMISQDKLVADTEERKNELESEIYSTRNKVDEPYESNGYAEFCSEEEKAAIKDKCEKLEVSRHNIPLKVKHLLTLRRTGSTTTATTRPRPSTSPSWKSSAPPPAPWSSGSTTSAWRRRRRAGRPPRRPPRPSAHRTRPPSRPQRSSERPPKRRRSCRNRTPARMRR